MWDLSQSDERPCCSVKDGSLPTFKRGTALWHRHLRRFLSQQQMIRCMGFPTCAADRTAAALEDAWPLWPAIETAAGLPPNESRHIAGDAVNFHCMCAVLAVVFLFAERRLISAS